ncbi:hypothetical protein MKW98_018927, partial [Papaver atlanticum]
MTGSVPYFLCCQTSSSSRRTIAKRVESFIHQFDEISKQRSKFHLNPCMAVADVQSGIRQERETSSYTDEPTIYGREEDREFIVKLLQKHTCGSGNNRLRKRFFCL